MTNAAVAEAPVADTQTVVTPTDPQAPSQDAGTDGGKPAAQAPAQTADTPAASAPAAEAVTPEAVVATPERTLSAEEAIAEATRRLEASAADKARADDLKRTQGELRDLRRDGPKQVRGWLSKLEKGELDVVDFRENVENAWENLNLKALEAARLEIGDSGSKELQEEQAAFKRSCYANVDPANYDAFTKEVNGKDHAVWVKATQKYAPRDANLIEASSFATEAPALAADPDIDLNDSEKTALEAALKGVKTPAAITKALIKIGRTRGQRDPGGAPVGAERRSSGSPSSKEEAQLMHSGMHPSGQRITNAQMRTFNATGHI